MHVRRLIGCGIFVAAANVTAAQDLRLIEAVKVQDVVAVRALLQQRVDVNTSQPDGATALHWAALRDDVDIAKTLIRGGARVDATNAYGVTPIMLACTNGSAALIETLLKAGANVNTALPTGETALMAAARTGRVAAVRALLAHGADLAARSTEGKQTALIRAAAEGHADVSRVLIEAGADLHARSKEGFTPLLYAARGGHLDTVKVLLAAGADVNEAGQDDIPVLLTAVIRGHIELVTYLLEQGVDSNAAGPGYAPLHWAAGTWEAEFTFGTNAWRSEWGRLTGLKGAAKLKLIKLLLVHGANPNARTVRTPPRFGRTAGNMDPVYYELLGATPFLIAAMAGDLDAMRLLLAAGADPRIPTIDDFTPLMEAAGNGRVVGEVFVSDAKALELVKFLWDLGDADLNAINEFGETAVHGAAVHGYNGVIEFLASKGADLNVKHFAGDTPLSIASGQGARRSGSNLSYPETAQLLRSLGALEDPNPLSPEEKNRINGALQAKRRARLQQRRTN